MRIIKSLLIVALIAVMGCEKDDTDAADVATHRVERRRKIKSTVKIAERKPTVKAAKASQKSQKPLPRLPREFLKDVLTKARDNGSFKDFDQIIAAAKRSDDPQVRMDVVEVLGENATEMIKPLVEFVSDPDPKVASRALDLLHSSVDAMTDAYNKANTIETVMMLTDDDDALTQFAAKLETLPRDRAIRTIVSLSNQREENPAAWQKAQDEYQYITGEEFKDVSTAHEWMRTHREN